MYSQVAIWLPWWMMPYLELSVGLCYWQIWHSEVTRAITALVSGFLCCWPIYKPYFCHHGHFVNRPRKMRGMTGLRVWLSTEWVSLTSWLLNSSTVEVLFWQAFTWDTSALTSFTLGEIHSHTSCANIFLQFFNNILSKSLSISQFIGCSSPNSEKLHICLFLPPNKMYFHVYWSSVHYENFPSMMSFMVVPEMGGYVAVVHFWLVLFLFLFLGLFLAIFFQDRVSLYSFGACPGPGTSFL